MQFTVRIPSIIIRYFTFITQNHKLINMNELVLVAQWIEQPPPKR